MFSKIGVLQNFANFTGKHLCWSLIFVKLLAFRTSANDRFWYLECIWNQMKSPISILFSNFEGSKLRILYPRWYFNPGWKCQIFHIIDISSNPGCGLILPTREFLVVFFLKDDDFTNTFQMDRCQTCQSCKTFTRILKFIWKILILNIWWFQMMQGFEIIIMV